MKKILAILLVYLVVTSCAEEDLSFTVTPAVGFIESSKSVRVDNASDVEIFVGFSVPLEKDASVDVSVVGLTGFVYGTDFTTEPAANGGVINLALSAGSTTASFKYKGITQTIEDEIDMKVLFQLSGGTDISLGQPITLDFVLTLKPVVASEPITIEHNFEDCTEEYGVPPGFIEVTVPGYKTDRGWGCRSYGTDGSRAPRASAFGGEDGEDNAWLIMDDAGDFSGFSTVTLDFDVFSNYDGPGRIIVHWSSDYDGSSDPTGFTWNELTSINSQFPSAGSQAWTDISGDITGITGEHFYLAFQYVEGLASSSSSWDIDNLILTGI